MSAGPFTPTIRAYTPATFLLPTDAFIIDRIGFGTMYVEASVFAGHAITYVLDGGGSVLSTGIGGQLSVPFACRIYSSTLLADQVGSVVVDVWKAPYSAYPPNSGNTIVASSPPTIASAQKAQDTTLTGWTTQINANDTLMFNVRSVTAITRLTISLYAL